jgi:hypothetical protein
MNNKVITRIALAVSLFISSSATSLPNSKGNGNIAAANVIELPEVVISAKASKKARTPRKVILNGYLGFGVEGKVDTSVTVSIKEALNTYSGPKTKITSMRRHWGNKSAHEHGKAIDLSFDRNVIEWLVTEEGKNWLKEHSLLFYIEGRPGSKALKPYLANEVYRPFVFENPNASGRTGDHIHIQLKNEKVSL